MALPVDQGKVSIINCLRDLTCCDRCILRYLGVRTSEKYTYPEDSINVYLGDDKKVSDLKAKKLKLAPCRVCLDIFQDSTIDTYLKAIYSSNISDYDYSDYTIFVSFPKSILVRDYSIFLYLKEKFPATYSDLNDIEIFKRVFRMVYTQRISQEIGKTFLTNSNFELTFEIMYEDDETEIQNMKNIKFLNNSGKYKDTSRNGITDALTKCNESLFKEQFPVPPNIPTKTTTCRVHCKAEPMWIGGRYLKFSREMGQTPWLINDVSVTEHCLQDILFDAVEKVLGCDRNKLNFCASGREDYDVRMVGDGRPFYIQIDDPKKRSVSFKQFRDIEVEVFKTKLAAVIKLQEVLRNDTTRIKVGEQFKMKHYLALCKVLQVPNVQDVVNHINMQSDKVIMIHQKTPMRVLHRRTQAVRDRHIYRMIAKTVPDYPDLFEVEIVTQAGTYVKEFVNGDFERTQPSLTSIIQFPVDVVALDVVKIELDWPEKN